MLVGSLAGVFYEHVFKVGWLSSKGRQLRQGLIGPLSKRRHSPRDLQRLSSLLLILEFATQPCLLQIGAGYSYWAASSWRWCHGRRSALNDLKLPQAQTEHVNKLNPMFLCRVVSAATSAGSDLTLIAANWPEGFPFLTTYVISPGLWFDLLHDRRPAYICRIGCLTRPE